MEGQQGVYEDGGIPIETFPCVSLLPLQMRDSVRVIPTLGSLLVWGHLR